MCISLTEKTALLFCLNYPPEIVRSNERSINIFILHGEWKLWIQLYYAATIYAGAPTKYEWDSEDLNNHFQI